MDRQGRGPGGAKLLEKRPQRPTSRWLFYLGRAQRSCRQAKITSETGVTHGSRHSRVFTRIYYKPRIAFPNPRLPENRRNFGLLCFWLTRDPSQPAHVDFNETYHTWDSCLIENMWHVFLSDMPFTLKGWERSLNLRVERVFTVIFLKVGDVEKELFV